MGRSVLISSLDSDKIQGLGMSLKLFFLLFGLLAILVLADADPEGKKRSLSNGQGSEAKKTAKKTARINGSQTKGRKSGKGKGRKKKKGGRKVEKNNKKKRPSRRRKGGKRSGKGKIKGKGRSSRQSTVSDECLSQAVKMMKIWKDVVRNFEAQSKRIRSTTRPSQQNIARPAPVGQAQPWPPSL